MPKLYHQLNFHERRKVRTELAEEQGMLCYFCKKTLGISPNREFKRKYPINWELFPPNFLKYPIHLHHDHVTGECIGAVHSYCNAVLWQYHGE